MYDYYVSLGYNCEVAFQFRRVLGRDVAYMFNWMVTPLDSLHRIVANDFEGSFLKENIEVTADPDMLLDRAYGIRFHSPFRKELGRDLSGPRFEALYEQFQGKIALFKERFRGLAASRHRVLYVVKTDEERARERLAAFRDLMRTRWPEHDFEILALQLRGKEEPAWPEPRLHNRYMRRFAPTSDAPDGHLASWDKVFAEFPLKPGAMQAPY